MSNRQTKKGNLQKEVYSSSQTFQLHSLSSTEFNRFPWEINIIICFHIQNHDDTVRGTQVVQTRESSSATNVRLDKFLFRCVSTFSQVIHVLSI